MVETYSVAIRGTRPLLMHKFGVEERGTQRKRGTIPTPEEEVEKALYRTKEGTVFIPSMWIEGAITNAARNYRMAGQGRRTFRDVVRASVVVDPMEILIEPQEWRIDQRSVVVQRARILRARPIWDQWALKFIVQVNDERVLSANLKEFFEEAGRSVGIGDFRPKFGLFEVTEFKASSPSAKGGRG